ncbi:MAG: ABC-F family ATP-binding cassette domain-containing protein [Anaerolineae bacterium]|nr:ABC-F family ATP-binding cassette domain-containing protein [Anaerolineae bacterium]
MSILSVSNLSKAYGAEDIFNELSFSIAQRARIGLVGANGVGKTTLLRILLGIEEASGGEVTCARNLQMGYLPQQAEFDSSLNLWDECLGAFKPLLARQRELEALEHQMSQSGQSADILENYGRLQHEFELLGGYTYESRIRQTLSGLGFSGDDHKRPIRQLSGGQRTRARLARLLLTSPDMLLLDEPTNHLDIEAIEWLESYLRDWPGAALIISHDRYFLNQVADYIWEMTPALETYRGNYSAYIQQRQERYQRRLEEFQSQQEFIEKEEEYIRRNIAGQNTRQAQGRRKRLERLLEEARLTPPPQSRRLHLSLKPASRSGDLVLRTHDLNIGYADDQKVLFQVPDLTLIRGECAAIIGPNGAGKTTLLKTLLGQIPALQGEAVLGASLKIAYFAQAHEDLHLQWTLMEEIQAASPGMLPAAARDYLAKFLFSGDDVFKKIEVLSGGERGRLALACLALQGANLLLLDEPTNHLDLPSQEVLQAILADFGGTILLVSHDRYLIDSLGTQIWEVEPEAARLSVFNGTYSEYKAARQAAAEAAPVSVSMVQSASATPLTTGAGAKNGGLSKNEQYRRQLALEALEKEISALEDELKKVSAELENPPGDFNYVETLGQKYLQLQSDLEARYADWEKLN